MIKRDSHDNVDVDENSELFNAIGAEVAQTFHLMKIGDTYQTANGGKNKVAVGRMVYSIIQEHIAKAS